MADPRATYALEIQALATKEIDSLKSNRDLTSPEWALPLQAAPSAVCTMAILIKTASKKEVAGMEVESQDIFINGTVIGQLPSKLFDANLRHCGDLGQSAFRKAQTTMDLIQNTASGMTMDNGTISYIIDLLEDPEAAKSELMPTINDIEEATKQCKEEIRALCQGFEYWYWVICSLRTSAVERKGFAQDEQNERGREKKRAKGEQELKAEKEAAARKKIEQVELQLKEAEDEVNRAETEIKRLEENPLVPEPSIADEIIEAEKAVAAIDAHNRDGVVGKLKRLKNATLGESQKQKEERMRKRDEYVAEQRARRDQARQRADDRLRAAKENKAKLRDEIAKAREERLEQLDQHLEAKNDMDRAADELKRLGDEKMELNAILKVLDGSIHQLGQLKTHVNQLVQFFDKVLVQVRTSVDQDVKRFLDPIKRNANTSTTMANAVKKRIIIQSLHIQSSFSAIQKISGTFVHVSERYIMPAIAELESLGTVPNAEWTVRSEAFSRQCETSMQEIRQLAIDTSANMKPEIESRIHSLKLHAIQAGN